MALGLAIGGAIIGTAASVGMGIAQKNEADRQAAELLKQSEELRLRSDERKNRVRREGRGFQGDQTAAIAAAGVEVSGSPLDALVETGASVREEISDIDRSFRFERQQLRDGASRVRRQGNMALAGGVLGGVSSGLSSSFNIARSKDLF